jgi:hypothetical protein
MAKSKAKKATASKTKPATGMVVKAGIPGSFGKPAATSAHKNYSATKKSGMQSIPRKTQ